MGTIQTKQQLPDKKNFYILDYGYCRVWKRKTDSTEIMQQYQLTIESQQRLKSFENVWPLRTNHKIFVNVYYFSHYQATNFCGEIARGSLFTERIIHRLSEFANVKYPETVGILKSCIEGYNILYQNFGLFFVRSTMIGFTQNYQTKIWFHTDFSQPQPENPNCKTLQEMFISLISAVESSCEYLFYNCPRFSQFIVQTNYIYLSKDFNWLMNGLQNYIQKLSISIPSSLHRIKDLIKQPEGWEKFKSKKMYPKLITSQSQICSQLKLEAKKSSNLENYFFQKQVYQSDKNQMLTPTLKKSFSNNSFENQTSNRRLFESFAKESHPITLANRNYSNNISQSLQVNTKRDQIKFWRSSQKINGDFQIQNKLIGESNLSRFYSPSHKMNFQPVSTEYFGQRLPQTNPFIQKRFSDTKNTENRNFGRKSFDMSTDTRGRDTSMKSQISLIQDLEIQAKRSIPSRQLKFD